MSQIIGQEPRHAVMITRHQRDKALLLYCHVNAPQRRCRQFKANGHELHDLQIRRVINHRHRQPEGDKLSMAITLWHQQREFFICPHNQAHDSVFMKHKRMLAFCSAN